VWIGFQRPPNRPIQRNPERKDLATANQSRRTDDVFKLDVVEGADLVVLAPAAPVLELLSRLGDRFFADGNIHRGCSCRYF